MQQFDKITATFAPRRTDDLLPGVVEWIGRKLIWQAYWVIEEGSYEGEWAMAPCDVSGCPFAWVPSGDLMPNH